MILTEKDLLILSTIAGQAAREAGDMIASRFGRQNKVSQKAGGSSASQVVTEVDLKSESIIKERMRQTLDEFDLGFLSEETPDDRSRLEKDYFWCIDPLDGTLSFVNQEPGSAVSIGLVTKAGKAEIGVAYDIANRDLYVAVSGKNVTMNGSTFREKRSEDKKLLFIASDHSFDSNIYIKEIKEHLKNLAELMGLSGVHYLPAMGGVMNAITLMRKQNGIYFKFPKKEEGGGSLWDYSAITALYHCLGLSATDIHLGALELNRADSLYMNHRGAIFATSLDLALAINTMFHSLTGNFKQ